VAKVIERARARYDVEDVEYGTVYRWKPESVLVECGCGGKTSLTHSETACEECGAEHTWLVGDDLSDRQSQGDEEVHPWRYSEDREDDTVLPY
jgi:hypothetical protein